MRRHGRRLENRRGFTLVLMAMLLTVFIGAAAFAVDISQMHVYRAQLQSAADAAALAAAKAIMDGTPGAAEAAAIDYAARHNAGGTAVSLVSADVVPGTWVKTPSPLFTSTGGVWAAANADSVKVRYTGQYGFGRFFGLTSKNITASATGVVGYVGASTCIMPMAVPYQKLLDQLYPPDGTKPVSYDLTPTDVENLRIATSANEVMLKAGNANSTPVSGSFYLLQMGPFAHSDGVPLVPGPSTLNNNEFGDLFNASGNNCSARTTDWMIGTGDYLQGKQGAASGPMANGFEQLCQLPRNTISGNNSTYICTAPLARRTVKVVMWATEGNPGGCSPRCYQVKYAGVFVVTKYLTSSGGPGAEDGLFGYFSSMAAEGTFSTTPSPIKKIALVH